MGFNSPRPNRKQAPAKRTARQQTPIQQVVTPDPETVITVPVNMSTNCGARVPVRIPLVPPVRLVKCIGKGRSHNQEAVTGDRKRQAYITRGGIHVMICAAVPTAWMRVNR